MIMNASTPAFRIVTDPKGRRYRVGESPQSLMGRSRAWMMWLPWIVMMAVSVFEYGYGAAADTLQLHNHWSRSEAFWLVTIWAVFQAGIAFPAGRLREKNVLPVRTAMSIGAVGTAIGFFTVANSGNLLVDYLGYSVIGGASAGLVYASSINIVAKWYPERKGARVGFVNGGFAYGAVPFIYLFSLVFNENNYKPVLDAVSIYMFVVIGACALFFKDPPKDWWPAEVDPLEWAKSQQQAKLRSMAKNPAAVGQFSTAQALRTGQLGLMWFSFFLIGDVSLFGSAYQVPFAGAMGFGSFVAASSAGVLSVVNGVGRAAVGWLSDHLGRKQTLILVLLVEAFAQFGLLWAGEAHALIPFIAMAFLAGFGGGAFFPLFASIVPDYFGENNNASNYGFVYSAKLGSAFLGIGIGSSVIAAWGYKGAYIAGGFVGILAAVSAFWLRQPRVAPKPVAASSAPGARARSTGIPATGQAVAGGQSTLTITE